MSTTTGSPLNLNKFGGGDKVYDALTTLFNQNMDKLNSALTNVPNWKPNTSYVVGNIVKDPYHALIMVCWTDHTSSEQTSSEADWGPLNGVYWAWLEGKPRIYGEQPAYYTRDSLAIDGTNGQLVQVKTNGFNTDHTWFTQNTNLIADNIPNWEPNRKYRIGDLVYIGNLGDVDHGQIYHGVLRCVVAHTSGVQMGANFEGGNWQLTTPDSYHIAQKISLPYTGANVFAKRDGFRTQLTWQGQINNAKSQSWWADGAEVVPEQFRPDTFEIYIHAPCLGNSAGLQGYDFKIQPNGRTAYIHSEDPSTGRSYAITAMYYSAAVGMIVPAGIPTF